MTQRMVLRDLQGVYHIQGLRPVGWVVQSRMVDNNGTVEFVRETPAMVLYRQVA